MTPIQLTIDQLKQGARADLSTTLGVIRASGADARTFLHAQLTQDVEHLTEQETKLAGYCNIKGRLYAIFQMHATDDAVYLVTRRELIEPLLKRLRMFVLRAKVVLEDVSDAHQIFGITGDWCLAAGVAERNDGVQRLGVLPATVEGQTFLRELVILPKEGQLCAGSESMTDIGEAGWQWLSVMAGEPHVETATYEAFVPQMVNFDRIGGVSFKKGCYPGQEVVARSHYLGKLKRRMIAARWTFDTDAAAQAAIDAFKAKTDVYSNSDTSQPAGVVVAAAVNLLQANVIDALLEVSLPMLEGDVSLSVQGVEATAMRFELPYALAD